MIEAAAGPKPALARLIHLMKLSWLCSSSGLLLFASPASQPRRCEQPRRIYSWSCVCLCLQRKSLGEDLFSQLVKHIQLLESDYFGLEYKSREGAFVSALSPPPPVVAWAANICGRHCGCWPDSELAVLLVQDRCLLV